MISTCGGLYFKYVTAYHRQGTAATAIYLNNTYLSQAQVPEFRMYQRLAYPYNTGIFFGPPFEFDIYESGSSMYMRSVSADLKMIPDHIYKMKV